MGSVLSFSPSDVAVALLKNKSNWCFSYMLIIYKSWDYTYTNHLIQIMRCHLEIIIKTLKQIFVWTMGSKHRVIVIVMFTVCFLLHLSLLFHLTWTMGQFRMGIPLLWHDAHIFGMSANS